jgi:hypothetical protein
MDDLSTVAQGFDLRLYCRVYRIDAKVDHLPQILPLEIVIILRAGLRTLDDAPPISSLFCDTWYIKGVQ